jgi:hypothetical protein
MAATQMNPANPAAMLQAVLQQLTLKQALLSQSFLLSLQVRQ